MGETKIVCKGSIAFGNACMKCEKCKQEMQSMYSKINKNGVRLEMENGTRLDVKQEINKSQLDTLIQLFPDAIIVREDGELLYFKKEIL